MSSVLNYPNPTAQAENIFTQETFDRLTTHLLSWIKTPGAFGSIHICLGRLVWNIPFADLENERLAGRVAQLKNSTCLLERNGVFSPSPFRTDGRTAWQ
jgi:hypothetical protein